MSDDAHTGELRIMMMASSIMAADEERKFGRPASAVGARESRSRPVFSAIAMAMAMAAIAILWCCSHGSDNQGNSGWTTGTPLGTHWERNAPKVCGVFFGWFFMVSTFYPLDLRNDTCVALANL